MSKPQPIQVMRGQIDIEGRVILNPKKVEKPTPVAAPIKKECDDKDIPVLPGQFPLDI